MLNNKNQKATLKIKNSIRSVLRYFLTSKLYPYKNDFPPFKSKIRGIYEDFKTWFQMIKLVQNQLKFFFRNLAKEEIKLAKKEIRKIEKDMRLIFTPYEKNNQREFIFNNFAELQNFRKGR